ncbi:MAG: phosphoribosylformylglycinamidine synthase subunit PurS [Bacteroidia bacterium]|nr:phosphoribosylformylglycinamidine synthase subunit PurS [Bacteroidia bacterium]MDW8159778.1 phosphoribosylformylglycinamidine synthase subunit PurS [Bacteroidia bacterium]
MRYFAQINILPRAELLDPKGKTTEIALRGLGFSNVHNVRIGKHITLELEAVSLEEASEQVEKMAQQLLANLVIENYEIQLKPSY